MNSNLQWPALESDPNIFMNYFHSLGVKSDLTFTELLALDYEDFLTVEGPVLGVILNFERGASQTVRTEQQKLQADQVPYYMKQTDVLDNACGLIAVLHAIGNSSGKAQLEENSIIDRFFQQVRTLPPNERAKVLETFNDFKTAHSQFANMGQSSTTEQVKNHYICFIHHNNSVVELDGILDAPFVVKQGVSQEEFLKAAVTEIQRRFNSQEINEGMNVMIITNGETVVHNLLAE